MKKLDFSGGFLSVISGNVILKYPLKSLAAKSKTIPPSNQTPIFTAILIKPNFKTFLIIENGSKTPQKSFFFFFFETTKRQISAKIPPIYATLTKYCDKILCF
ncbi:hypothetical protein [Helicobacter pylori]|uniref:hypothetical protein n=1 Tax=Helicobacter pylori TaxID=210 RepID=UPI003467A5B6